MHSLTARTFVRTSGAPHRVAASPRPRRGIVPTSDTLPRSRRRRPTCMTGPSGSTPYNWHPLVHKQHFDETLYFAMIRLDAPRHVPVAQQMRELLHSVGIEYACEYVLFGWHDAFIRVWLKASTYQRFMDTLAECCDEGGIEGFTVDRIHYLWRGDADLLSSDTGVLGKITRAKTAIDKVAERPNDTGEDDWQKLFNLKLVFDRPSAHNGVKFYTLLERTSTRVSPEKQIDMILRALGDTPIPNTDKYMSASASLYCGKGELANFLVRCVAPSYRDIITLAETFDINLKEAELRPTTLVAANPEPREYDHPNDSVHLSLDDRNTAEMLKVEHRLLDKLDEHNRVELRCLVEKACNLAEDDTVLEDQLLAMMRATVIKKRNLINDAFGFLVEFEGLFGDLVMTSLKDAIGDNWFPRLKDWCTESRKKRYRDLAVEMALPEPKMEWTLGTYRFLALAGAEFSQKAKGYFEEQLGTHWAKEITALEKLRNDHAHSRLYQKFKGHNIYDKTLTDYLGEHMKAAALWRKCSRDNDEI